MSHYEWECPKCGLEFVALDEQAALPTIGSHLDDCDE